MAAIISSLGGLGALYGLFGAFIYAGPRFVLALAGTSEQPGRPLICFMDFVVCLVVGLLAAAMFGAVLDTVTLTIFHLKANNAVCGVIGLFANRIAPMLVDKGSSALDSGVSVVARVLKALKGDDKS